MVTLQEILALSVAFALALFPSPSECLKCFVCSAIANPAGCPTLKVDSPQMWSRSTSKYYDASSNVAGAPMFCLLGYSTLAPKENQVFFQVGWRWLAEALFLACEG